MLRQARGDRSIVEVAAAAGMSAETLRKIETGRIATPPRSSRSRRWPTCSTSPSTGSPPAPRPRPPASPVPA
ncbi:helix-turn-helix transcriptional regulator [Nonomuraea salmonea]|uniref:helix-turn-helix domain-containing protein n=1 Tax=Nonomuraea salmonea TaxID=46181 RepID=UPI0031EEBDAA